MITAVFEAIEVTTLHPMEKRGNFLLTYEPGGCTTVDADVVCECTVVPTNVDFLETTPMSRGIELDNVVTHGVAEVSGFKIMTTILKAEYFVAPGFRRYPCDAYGYKSTEAGADGGGSPNSDESLEVSVPLGLKVAPTTRVNNEIGTTT